MSKVRVWLLLICVALVSTAHSQPKPADIALPDPLAVELPPGRHDLAPSDPPLRDLLGGAHSGMLKVTADVAAPVGPGPVKVTWTAWDASGKPTGTRSGVVYVLPTGMTPIGSSSDENATGGNNAARIVRDPAGHVHLLWVTAAVQVDAPGQCIAARPSRPTARCGWTRRPSTLLTKARRNGTPIRRWR